MTNIKVKHDTATDWHPADIVAALKKRGLSMRGLSVHHGYSPYTLKSALNSVCPKYQKIIADAIGVSPQTIWPSRYQPKKTVADVLRDIANELPSSTQFSAINVTSKESATATCAAA